jgi:hypothetical protein
MDSMVWDQISLDPSTVDLQSTVESQRSGQRRDSLVDQFVHVGVSWSFDIELSSADVIDSSIVKHNSIIGVFQKGVGGQDRVV